MKATKEGMAKVFLRQVERGEKTLQELIDRKEQHLAINGPNADQVFIAGLDEAITTMQSQQ